MTAIIAGKQQEATKQHHTMDAQHRRTLLMLRELSAFPFSSRISMLPRSKFKECHIINRIETNNARNQKPKTRQLKKEPRSEPAKPGR